VTRLAPSFSELVQQISKPQLFTPMFETICTLPLSSDLFAQAIHPRDPVVAVGLSSGHVESFRLPPIEVDEDEPSSPSKGCGLIESAWRTRRHKISCRCLSYSVDGTTLYSAGADGIVKAASATTGQVSCKVAIPLEQYVYIYHLDGFTSTDNVSSRKTNGLDAPSLLHALSPQTLFLATDSSALHIYDLRSFSQSRPQATYWPHDDYIASITPLPPGEASTSGFSKQWVSVGGTTLAVTDIRKGVVNRSADQEAELLSTAHVDGFSKRGTNVGSKIVVGDGNGVLTLWERGVWDDQDERIVLDRSIQDTVGESVECLSNVPQEIAGNGKMLAAGMGGGLVACVQLGQNKVVEVFRHDEVEAVVSIGFDVGNRMISGGGQTVKVWQEKLDADAEDSKSEGESQVHINGESKRSLQSDSGDSDDDSTSDDEERAKQSRKKKKQRRKGGLSQSCLGMGSFKDLD
jgi:hypothetical protein